MQIQEQLFYVYQYLLKNMKLGIHLKLDNGRNDSMKATY